MRLNLVWILFFGMNQLPFNTSDLQDSDTQALADCIIQVAYLVAKRKIGIQFSREYQDLASKILQRTNVSVVLNLKETRVPSGIEYRTSTDFMIILNMTDPESIVKNTLWYRETKFLVVSEDNQMLKDLFEDFWKLRVINAFVMVPSNKEILTYSYLPFGPDNCSVVAPLVVETCSDGKLYQNGSAFTEKIRIKNMNGCPINITVNNVEPHLMFKGKGKPKKAPSIGGFEGKFLYEVSKALNYTPTYKEADDGLTWGWVKPSPIGTIGDIYKGVSEIGSGMLGDLLDRYENLDTSNHYYFDECLSFGVPKGLKGQSSAWITIFVSEFNFLTWALIAVSFILMCVSMWLNKWLSRANWFSSNADLVSDAFSSCLGLPIKVPNNASVKTSIAGWVIFTFIITVAYKASMGSKLAVPPHDADIFNYKELIASGIELCGEKSMIQLFKGSDDWVYKIIRKQYVFRNYTLEEAVEKLADGERFAFVRHTTSFYYFAFINVKARGRIHVLTDCIIAFQPSVVMRKFSPFTNKVNQMLIRLEESGILPNWRKMYLYKIPKERKPFHKLSSSQMIAIYWLLILGYAIAFVVFLYENYHFRYKQSRRKDVRKLR